tara:strand:- start:28560 stop:29189 length:630 start_codon:yes stop_codon:yes gene_type:complete
MEFSKKIIVSGIFTLFIGVSAIAQNNFSNLQEAFQKSYALEAKGNFKEAAAQLKAVYQANVYETNLRLGWLNYMAGNFKESIAFYKKSMNIFPYADEPKFGYIFPLSALGRWDEVIVQYKEILTNSPNNTKALYYLGNIYYNRGQYDKAILNFQKVVDLYPFDYDGMLMYGWANLQLGKKKEAKVLFQKVLLNKPKDASALQGLALTSQ